VLCHTLSEEEDDAYSRDPLLYVNPSRNQSYGSGNANGGVTGLPKNASPEPMDSNGDSDSDSDSGRTGYFDSRQPPERKVTFSGPFGDVEGLPSVQKQSSASVRGVRSSTLDTIARRRARRERLRHTQAIERLKAGDRVDVRVHPLCVFLLRSGTVITLTRSDPPEFAVPIVRRLQHRDTALRLSADPTLLVHALLDLVVDGQSSPKIVGRRTHFFLRRVPYRRGVPDHDPSSRAPDPAASPDGNRTCPAHSATRPGTA
jgi:hypothetical protein